MGTNELLSLCLRTGIAISMHRENRTLRMVVGCILNSI